MPGRNIVLANNEIYHIFNRGIASQLVFFNKRTYERAIETIFYYQNKNTPIKYSKFLKLSMSERSDLLKESRKRKDWLVEIISYCLMPNHFHLLLKQLVDNGISKFVGDFTNSYTRYINTKQERNGPIFEGKFKSVRVETEEQLLHVQRYIHLNPYTSYLIKTIEDLETYTYSSFPEYTGKHNSDFCSKDIILGNFKNISSYKKFIFDQADYQRQLANMRHLLFE